MLNKNAFRTSLIFLGIIAIILFAKIFISGDALFVNLEKKDNLADTFCTVNSGVC